MESKYETEELLNQYLLFHYGEERDQMPFTFDFQKFLNFPIRCACEFAPQGVSALDLGCAVGRSTFELAKTFTQVIGVDRSHHFINAAKQIQEFGSIEYKMKGEGLDSCSRTARLPEGIDPARVEFRCMDAAELDEGKFDLVLAANLICRLQEPANFLQNIHRIMAPKGKLILITPYSWVSEFTVKEKFLNSFSEIETLLKKRFHLEMVKEMPFLIREHYRKYELGISQASVWVLNDILSLF